jgi:DNA-binding transcriptional ArsR family regulator
MANLTRKERRAKWRLRTDEERVAFSFANSVRWRLVAALHGRERSAADLARLVGLSHQAASYHIKELEAAGAIELARPAEDAAQHIYRAIKPVAYSDEEFAHLTPDERQSHTRLILTSFCAEIFSSWEAEMMLDDPDLFLVWDWSVQLDEEGCREWRAEEERHAEAKNEIKMRSLERSSESGGALMRKVYGIFSFARDRRLWGEPAQGA